MQNVCDCCFSDEEPSDDDSISSLTDDEISIDISDSEDMEVDPDGPTTGGGGIGVPVVLPPFLPPLPLIIPIPGVENDDSDYEVDIDSGGSTKPTLTLGTPTIITSTESEDFARPNGFVGTAAFQQARCFPLSLYRRTLSGSTTVVIGRNRRTAYGVGGWSNVTLRIPYYWPTGVALSQLPFPQVEMETIVMKAVGGADISGTVTLETTYLGAPYTTTWTYNATDSAVTYWEKKGAVLKSDQFSTFGQGQFNEFFFNLKCSNTSHLNLTGNRGLMFFFTQCNTLTPTGTSFEFKTQNNFTSYFGIRVVSNSNRLTFGSPIGTVLETGSEPTTVSPAPSYYSGFRRDNYNTTAGFRHWEVKLRNVWPLNVQYDMNLLCSPEDNLDCSMEPDVMTPGPNPPWNLASRHETYQYGICWMRDSDFAQQASPTATFYMPQDWRAVVWLKPGVANNDLIPI